MPPRSGCRAGGVDVEAPTLVAGEFEGLEVEGGVADQVLEVLVVRVASGLGAQEGDGIVLDLVEVDEELRRRRAEEGEAGGVGGVRFLVVGPAGLSRSVRRRGESRRQPAIAALRVSGVVPVQLRKAR